MNAKNLLLVDIPGMFREALVKRLTENDWTVIEASNSDQADSVWAMVSPKPTAAIIDAGPNSKGLDIAMVLRAQHPELLIIMLITNEATELAPAAGVTSFWVSKSVKTPDEVIFLLEHYHP